MKRPIRLSATEVRAQLVNEYVRRHPERVDTIVDVFNLQRFAGWSPLALHAAIDLLIDRGIWTDDARGWLVARPWRPA